MQNISISEYGFIGCDNISTSDDRFVGNRNLEPDKFKELYDFWLEDKETQKIFTFENKQCLKATSYVGIIQTQNLSIEILPKIYSDDEDSMREIFIEMLKPLLGINEVQINKADLSTTKDKNIYEIFISLFIKYMEELIKKGLKSDYILREENQFFLKGKLKFNEHIKRNHIHKERFYVEFDEYLPNRAENRLLKSTLKLLLSQSKNFDNKRRLRQQLFIFDEVGLSKNIDSDLAKIDLKRGMKYYDIPLKFAKIFLKSETFTSLRGKNNVFALLFPMERVFEKYMEFVLKNSKKELGIEKILVNGGENEYFLKNGDCKMARLQPDYLLKMKDETYIVTDAKWKLYDIKSDENKCSDGINISNGDVYQIFSYLNFYDCQDTAYIFVPKSEVIEKTKRFNYQTHVENNKSIEIIPIDLKKVIDSNHKILDFLVNPIA